MCTVELKRESRLAYGARKIHIYVDGTPTLSVKNGGTCLVPLKPGKHEISFFLGKKLLTDVKVNIEEETGNFCIVFWITNNGEIETKLTNNDVEYDVNQRRTQSSGLYILLGVIITLLALFLIEIRITPVIYFFPIK